jgi:hypothetical protein
MSHLRPEKLHTRFAPGVTPQGPITPRRYTLTHSDATGDLFLTVGADYDRKQISGWYTRLLRDEVLAEWREDEDPAGWRYGIFRHHMPQVLEAFRLGDQELFEAHPALDSAPIWVHFHAVQRRYNRKEHWSTPADYRPHETHAKEPESVQGR